jgi:septal ring factor EnvC (AmiA/AmiB activator)
MKTVAVAVGCAVLALVCLPSAQDKTKDGPLERLMVVEKELAQTKDKLAKQQAELTELKDWVARGVSPCTSMLGTPDWGLPLAMLSTCK